MKLSPPRQTWSIDMRQDWIDVTSGLPTANEDWRGTDVNGHEHYYGYPTLDEVDDASHWCNGDEGIAHHDPHMHVDESHYECKVCRAVVEPAVDPPFTPKQIPGMATLTLTGLRSDGVEIVASLIQAELLTIQADRTTAQGIIDAIPDERIHQRRQRA